MLKAVTNVLSRPFEICSDDRFADAERSSRKHFSSLEEYMSHKLVNAVSELHARKMTIMFPFAAPTSSLFGLIRLITILSSSGLWSVDMPSRTDMMHSIMDFSSSSSAAVWTSILATTTSCESITYTCFCPDRTRHLRNLLMSNSS